MSLTTSASEFTEMRDAMIVSQLRTCDVNDAAVLRALQAAGGVLGLPALPAQTPADWLAQAVAAWAGIIAAFPSSSDTP